MLLGVLLASLAAAENRHGIDLVTLEEVSVVPALRCEEVDLAPFDSATSVVGDNAAIVYKAACVSGARHGQPVEFCDVERCPNLDALGIHRDAAKWSQGT